MLVEKIKTKGMLVSKSYEYIPEPIKDKKALEQDAIDNLTVTVNDKVFDANPEARRNMADAILASDTAGLTETIWRLADNTEQVVTIDELKQAHLLALQAYAQVKGIS
jgi:hypothetical protein